VKITLVAGVALLASAAGMHVVAEPGGAAIVEVDAASNPNLFVPQDVTIAVGDTVRWTAVDNVPHDVTSDTVEPDDGEFASSGTFDASDPPYEVQFNTAGTYVYYCTIHASEGQYPGGMTGKVIVQAAPTATATNTSTAPTATRTSGPSSTPTRTPTRTQTGTVTAVPTATVTPVSPTLLPATPGVPTPTGGTPTVGDARAGITGPRTGTGATRDGGPQNAAAALAVAGVVLIFVSFALSRRRT
jgi:plastocyanin